jgi:Lon-like protease
MTDVGGNEPRDAGLLPPDGPIAAPPRRRRRRWPTVVTIVGTVIVLAALISSIISVPYYAITPGRGVDVSPLITVPSKQQTHTHGSVLLTDVEVTPMRALTYLYYRYFDSDADVEPNINVIGLATPAQYAEQGVIDMGNARQAAAVNALRELGYRTRATANGVIVYQPLPDSPSARALSVGDIVTALDGTPTLTSAALNAAVSSRQPGTSVTLSVHRFVARDAVTSTPPETASSTVHVALGIAAEVRDGVPICVPVHTPGIPKSAHGACLGIESTLFEVEQSYATVDAPFPISISADDIGGPSAGLAFTLGVIAELDHSSLTGGKTIAATGTMAMNGDVGDVGGVAQKTIAVERAGATVFLVPPQEYAVAKSHATSSLHVYEVSTLAAALKDLRSLGGTISKGPAAS